MSLHLKLSQIEHMADEKRKEKNNKTAALAVKCLCRACLRRTLPAGHSDTQPMKNTPTNIDFQFARQPSELI